MKCEISGLNIKVFYRGLHFLARIGDEIHFEAFESGLCLSTVNNNKTAYGSIKFESEFFSEYDDAAGKEDETQCKVSIKHILPVFRSLKQIERGSIQLDRKSCKLVFLFICRQKVSKKHSIPILDFSRLDELVVPENFSNKITGSHKLMNGILGNFHKSCREIKFDVKSDTITIKNHIDNEDNDHETIRSNYTLRIDEFDTFAIKQEGSIAFTFADFRAMCQLAEASEAFLKINFDAPGEPLCMSCRHDFFVANLLVATMLHDMEDTAPDILRSKTPSSAENSEIRSRKRNRRVIDTQNDGNPFNFMENEPRQKAKKVNETTKSDEINETEDKTPQTPQIPIVSIPESVDDCPETPRNRRTEAEVRPSILPAQVPSIPVESASYVSLTTSSELVRLNKKASLHAPAVPESSVPSIVESELLPKESEEVFFDTEDSKKTSEDQEMEEVVIPESGSSEQTEEDKKRENRERVRYLFQNIIERRMVDPKTLPGADEILAPDSEGEDTSRLRDYKRRRLDKKKQK